MSDEVTNLLENTDYAEQQTEKPLAPAGIYEVEVQSIKQDKSSKGGDVLDIVLSIIQPFTSLPDAKGRTTEVGPGYLVFHTLSLNVTKHEDGRIKYDPRASIAAFMECFTGSKVGKFNPVERFLNQRGTVRLSVEKSDQFGDKNRVAKFVAKG